MGIITQYERILTDSEIGALTRLKQDPYYSKRIGIARVEATALEYMIEIDRIVKPSGEGLPPQHQLYLLKIDPQVDLGFELCFMRDAAVTGTFPKSRLQVAFAVSRSETNAGWEDVSPSKLAIGFTWTGASCDVIDAPEHLLCDDVYPINRLEGMQAAFKLVDAQA